MKLVRGAWKILVGIKDFLVLIAMLLFFTGLFAVLSHKPNKAGIHDGALVIALNGVLSEQPSEPDPLDSFGGSRATSETRLRDVLAALDAARTDDRVKAVVLDMDRFMGGYPAAISEVAAATGRVRAAGKPVLAYATGYTDDSYAVAANASEVWMHPFGGTLFMGPGGTHLYYKGLLDKLGVTAHIYKVGKFKSAVEPYARSDMSPEARQANEALYGAVFGQWQQAVAKARPKAKLGEFLTRPDAAVTATQGDIAKANMDAGLIDKLGDRLAFGKRVAEIAGAPSGKAAGNFRSIKFADFVAAHTPSTSGDAIGVITVAGEIVDGRAGPGTAGGETVSQLLLKGLAERKLKALVVRVDSPGGSVLASEQIRQAILQAKAQGLPVVVSMGSLAASGGYWVSMVGAPIFAEPDTITGSIGIFGVLPSFENSLAKIGVTTDGVRTTPLSGQPDVMGGFTPAVDTVLQAGVDQGYQRFIRLVAAQRKLSPQRVDEIGQGHVWIGGTAHQLGLVDRFGGLKDAIDEAARLAKLDPAKVHAVHLEKEGSGWLKLLGDIMRDDDRGDEWVDAPAGGDAFARVALEQRALVGQAMHDARRLAGGGSMQARCLECGGLGPSVAREGERSLFEMLFAAFSR